MRSERMGKGAAVTSEPHKLAEGADEGGLQDPHLQNEKNIAAIARDGKCWNGIKFQKESY